MTATPCSACNGDGLATGPPECRPCRRCRGTGEKPMTATTERDRLIEVCERYARGEPGEERCGRCKGKRDWHDALTGDGRCYDCRGTGYTPIDPACLAKLADCLMESADSADREAGEALAWAVEGKVGLPELGFSETWRWWSRKLGAWIPPTRLVPHLPKVIDYPEGEQTTFRLAYRRLRTALRLSGELP